MSVMKIEQWLTSLGFKQYTQLFIDNGYDDFELCRHLKEMDLDLMGITVPVVKAEILSSLNALKCSQNAAHIYFSMDPNYWQVNGTVSGADSFNNFNNQNHSKDDSGVNLGANEPGKDVYNTVLRELNSDGVTPRMLLSFPVTLKSRAGSRTPDKKSDSGNDSDQEEIYCAQDLASIYEDRLSIPRERILNALHCIQRLHYRKPEFRTIEMRSAYSSGTGQLEGKRQGKLQDRVQSFDVGHGYNPSLDAESTCYNNKQYASKTLGRIPSYQKPKNIVTNLGAKFSGSQSNLPRRSVTPSKSVGLSKTGAANKANVTARCTLSSSSSIGTGGSRDCDLMFNTNVSSSNNTADFSSDNSLDSAAFLVPK